MNKLTHDLIRHLPKKYRDRVASIEREDDLVDDCKYMLYYTDAYTDGDCAGSSYPVRSLSEAIDFVKHSLFKVSE